MKSISFIISFFLLPIFSYAVVDMKNANYSETWTDISIPSSGYPLRIERVYNSRSLFNGIFGFGWCSDYETNIVIEGDGALRLTECGGGLEIKYTAKNFSSKNTKKHLDNLIKKASFENPRLSKSNLNQLRKDIKGNSFMRIALERKLKMTKTSISGKIFKANGKGSEFIEYKNGSYIRHLTDGTKQKYNKQGRLSHLFDKNSNYLKITYKNKIISTVIDNNGKQLSFSYYPTTGKVKKITGPGKFVAHYKFKNEDLIWSKNQWKSKFTYIYDDFHNLTKIIFPNKKFKKLTYNTNNDWVTSFKNLKGCLETYKYEVDKKSQNDHYWSKVQKKCNNKITNQSEFEFWYKNKTHQYGKYLYRVKSNINGKKTDIIYHSIFEKPILTKINGLTTNFSFYNNGLIKHKKERFKKLSYKYEKSCSKISEIKTEYFAKVQKKIGKKIVSKTSKKPVKTTKTNFYYQKIKCNLKQAKNSDGQKVWLKYDTKGRIRKITDQSKKIVNITYDTNFGKPKTVQRPGLGKITVTYSSDGQIKKVISKEGPRIAVQVANVFNNLLEIISPATTDIAL